MRFMNLFESNSQPYATSTTFKTIVRALLRHASQDKFSAQEGNAEISAEDRNTKN